MDRPKQLLAATFLLAAAGLAALGGLSYVDVSEPPPPVASTELASLEQSLVRALALASETSGALAEEDVDQIARAFGLVVDPPDHAAARGGSGSSPKTRRRARPGALPQLSGIIWADDADSTRRRRALIGGRGLEEGSSVDGYLVERIEEHGVTLARGRRRWFVEAPEVGFSAWREGEQ